MGSVVEFRKEVNRVMRLAEEMFNVDLSKVEIRIDLKGKTAGQASYRKNRLTGEVTQPLLRFNTVGVREHWDHLFYVTIPHEIAHLVCAMRRELGSNHDAGWGRVSVALGGKDDRCHSLPLAYAHGSYKYVASSGRELEVSVIRHRKIQKGVVYNFRGYGRVTKSDWVRGNVPQPKPAVSHASSAVPNDMSKAALMRKMIRELRAQGNDPAYHVELLIRHGVERLGFKNRGAARSCVLANLEKA